MYANLANNITYMLCTNARNHMCVVKSTVHTYMMIYDCTRAMFFVCVCHYFEYVFMQRVIHFIMDNSK